MAFPADCERCDESEHALNGCGYNDATAGKARAAYEGALGELRICPQWLYREVPLISWVLEALEDYRRGALGNVLDLDADLLDYLRIADAESTAWRNAMERQVAHGNGAR